MVKKKRTESTLYASYRRFVEKVLERNEPVTGYACPVCEKAIIRNRPRLKNESWSSLCSCPHCGAYSMVVVHGTGRVEAEHRDELGVDERADETKHPDKTEAPVAV